MFGTAYILEAKDRMKCENSSAWHDGSCCCNCLFRAMLMSHPWCNGMPVDHQIGWVCDIRAMLLGLGCEGGDRQVTLSREHGFCELHKPIKEGDDDRSRFNDG